MSEEEVAEKSKEEAAEAEQETEKKKQKPAIEKEEKPEEEIEIVEEKVYTFNLRKAWIAPRQKRTPRAVRMLKQFVKRHMKGEEVLVSKEVNEAMWARGAKKPPRKIRIRAAKDKEGKIIIYPITEPAVSA